MRLRHIADVHLERRFAWLGLRRGREQRAAFRATLRRVVDVARENKVNAICIGGDLFERENAPPSAGVAAFQGRQVALS